MTFVRLAGCLDTKVIHIIFNSLTSDNKVVAIHFYGNGMPNLEKSLKDTKNWEGGI